jgi:hypothetical protein
MGDQYPCKHLVYWLDGVLYCALAPVERFLCFDRDAKYLMAQQKAQYLYTAHHHLSLDNEVCTRHLL